MAATPEQIKWFKSLKTVTDISVLIKSLNLTPQTEAVFWKKFLALLKSEESPIRWTADDIGGSEDIQDEDIRTLMGFITQNADLKDLEQTPIYSALYNDIKELVNEGEDSFWNESMQKLIEFFIKNFEENENKVLLEIDGDEHDITVNVLKDADAGLNLPETRVGEQWVKPWWNIDNDSYDDVRKCDEVYNILKNQSKLQYTRAPQNPLPNEEESELIFKNWIRLLMPQYGRRVEIEDLDRNFWVIAQTIAAISAYLFDPDNPLSKMWEGLTREVSEIWENILYLWTGIAATTQKKNGSEVAIIHLPLQTRDNEHGRQYDYIDDDVSVDWYTYEDDGHGYLNITRGTNFDAEVEKRLAYLIERYADKNLCIIPYIRLENYKHNYYAASWYPGVYMYHHGTKEWTVYKLVEIPENVYSPNEETPTREIIISPKYERAFRLLQEGETLLPRFSSHIYSSKQSKDECIYYSSPFSKASVTRADYARFILYGCLQTSVSNNWVSCQATPNGFNFTRIDIDIYDAAAQLIEGGRVLGRLGYYTSQAVKNNIIYMRYYDEKRAVPENLEVVCGNPTAGYPGYYMGEVTSWKAKTMKESHSNNLFNTTAHVIKVGSYLRTGMTQFETARMSDQTHTLMRGNVTTHTSDINPDTNRSELKFYLNNWSTYLYDKDQLGQSSTDLCFSENPTEKSCTEINEAFLKKQGLIAVKNYLIKSNNLSQPCYVATAIGVTPWVGSGSVLYWDIGALCHIYHFIPSEYSLEVSPTDDSYEQAYDIDAVTIDGESGIMTIQVDGESVEVGKIISCNLIKKYDSFYDSSNWDMCDGTCYYSTELKGKWRQFKIISGNDEKCFCITINEGDPDEEVTYDVVFSTSFTGEVKYYDHRWASENNVDVFNDGCQVGWAPGITIDANGYSQSQGEEGEGMISPCTTPDVPLEARVNKARNNNDTGFMAVPVSGKIDFMSIPVDTAESSLADGLSEPDWIYT